MKVIAFLTSLIIAVGIFFLVAAIDKRIDQGLYRNWKDYWRNFGKWNNTPFVMFLLTFFIWMCVLALLIEILV